MNLTELRIGNLVSQKHVDGYIAPVFKILDDCIYTQDNEHSFTRIYAEDIVPIELSGVILEKCGFKWVYEAGGFANKDHTIYECGESGEFWWEFHPFNTNDPDCCIEVQYLHQLQNLIFSLTGQELPYKY